MSLPALGWAIKQETGAPLRKLVLIVLAEFHNRETGQCNPSLTTLAKTCNCSRRAIISAINDLETNGLLKKTHRFRLDNSRASTQYELSIPDGKL
jgi:predicted transcriptional regulator